VLKEAGDDPATIWIAGELFEGVPWIEQASEYLGPWTVKLLRRAQERYGESGITDIGRWRAPE